MNHHVKGAAESLNSAYAEVSHRPHPSGLVLEALWQSSAAVPSCTIEMRI